MRQIVGLMILAGFAGGCASVGSIGGGTELDLQAPTGGERLTLKAQLLEFGDESREIFWRRNGSQQMTGAESDTTTGTSSYTFDVAEGENSIEVSAPGYGARRSVRIYGQQMTNSPPLIDRRIEDWDDPPVVRLFPEKNGGGGERSEFSADAMVKWTSDSLFVGAIVTDLTEDLEDSLTFTFGDARMILYTNGEKVALDYRGEAQPGTRIRMAVDRNDSGYFIEARIAADVIMAQMPDPGMLMDFDLAVKDGGSGRELLWSNSQVTGDSAGYAVILPDPATIQYPGRSQLENSATEFKKADSATTDPSYLTPVPVEMPDAAIHLPDWLGIRVPYVGEFPVSNGYGLESTSWTHETIGNARSANDYYAIDFDLPVGTPIVAAAPGRIITSNRRGDSYGNYLVIDHGGGYHSIYAHLDSLRHYVDKGEPEILVQEGEILGLSGATGTSYPHLHFAMHKDTRVSHSGADVGGLAVIPEPMGPYYGIREGHRIKGE